MESTTNAQMSFLTEQRYFLKKELVWANNQLSGDNPSSMEYAELVHKKLLETEKEMDRVYSGVANGKILLLVGSV